MERPDSSDESSDVDSFESSDIDSSADDESSEIDIDSSVAEESSMADDSSEEEPVSTPMYNIKLAWQSYCNENSADPLTRDPNGTVEGIRKNIILDLMSSIDPSYECRVDIYQPKSTIYTYINAWSDNNYASINKKLFINSLQQGTANLSRILQSMAKTTPYGYKDESRIPIALWVVTDDYGVDTANLTAALDNQLTASGVKLYFLDLREGNDDMLEYYADNLDYLKGIISEADVIG